MGRSLQPGSSQHVSLIRSDPLEVLKKASALVLYCRLGVGSQWFPWSSRYFLSRPTRNAGSHQRSLDPTRYHRYSLLLSAHYGRTSTMDDDATEQIRDEFCRAGETLSASRFP
jgi:hypothetical protein